MKVRRGTSTAVGGTGDGALSRLLDVSVIDENNSGPPSGIHEPRFVTAKSSDAWQALWAEHKGGYGLPAPEVDFQTQIAVGVFAGERRCSILEIRRVVQEGGEVRVEYRESLPDAFLTGAVVCPTEFTYPAVLAVVARTDLPISFWRVSD